MPNDLIQMDWNTPTSESGDDFEEEIMTVLSTVGIFTNGLVQPQAPTRKWGGSVVGCRPNKRRKMRERMAHFNDVYFNVG